MPIVPLLQNEAFGPEDITVITAAFEDALKSLGLVDRTDPLTNLVAKAIIVCAQTGERNHIRLRDCALKSLRD